jgi:hypothetical protein
VVSARLQLALVACLALVAVPAVAETPAPPVGWLGITFAPDTTSARVTEVHPGTGAFRAGLHPGDEIVAIDDIPLGPGADLASLVAGRRIGQRIAVSLLREGRPLRLMARLTPKPTADEIVYQWLIDRVVPAVELHDRQGGIVPLSEWTRRPQVWMVFDSRCDPCAAVASTLRAHLMASAGGAPTAPLRVVVFGNPAETDAYLARVPVLGTVWRADRAGDDNVNSVASRFFRGGIDMASDGVMVVIDHHGVVRFATTISAGDAYDGACAAAARAMRAWRP